jgi:hypothetical protein
VGNITKYYKIQGFRGGQVHKIVSGYQPDQLVKNYRRFRNHLCPHKTLIFGTEIVPETFVIFNQLTWLIARENIINYKKLI